MKLQKILILDDDTDWQRNMSGSLKKAGYECTVVAAGDDALQELRERNFDLVILDLRIPYTEGTEATMATGIEILKEIRRSFPGIPVITVSAFGSTDVQSVADSVLQGASTFIEKGKMTRELLIEKVEAIFENSFGNIIKERFPTPFAYIYREIKSGLEPIKHFMRLMNLFELFLQFSAIILLYEYLEEIKSNEPFLTKFRDSIIKPSSGDWFSVIHHLLKARKDLKPGMMGKKILDIFTKKRINTVWELIEVRNTYLGHGAKLSDYEYKNLATKYEEPIDDLLRGLKPVIDFRLCSVSSLERVKSGFNHKMKECLGSDQNFILKEKVLENALLCNVLLLLNEEKEIFLSLHPLIILENCDTCKREDVFFYSKLKNDGLWYLNYETGHRIRRDRFLEDFKELVNL